MSFGSLDRRTFNKPNDEGVETLPRIEGLSDDLQMLGQYFTQEMRETEDDVRFLREDLNKVENPDPVASLHAEEESERLARDLSLSKKEKKEWVKDWRDEKVIQADIDAAVDKLHLFGELLRELKNGQHKKSLDFLRQQLDARGTAMRLIDEMSERLGEQRPVTEYFEREQARLRALRNYIALLETKDR